MGVYIRGMEIPKNCFGCPLFDDVYTDADGNDDYICGLGVSLDYYQASGETKKDCPLVPAPEHGRLIDADALKDKWTHKDLDLFSQGWGWLRDLNQAPTIIPASNEDE